MISAPILRRFLAAACVAQFSCAIGQTIEVPTTAQIVRLEIKRSAHRVALVRGDMEIKSFPVAIGRPGWETPTGTFHILQMQKNPTWKHPLTGEIFRAGEDGNELGRYWIGFSTTRKGAIGFHDTPHPETVGKPVTHGCLRMQRDRYRGIISTSASGNARHRHAVVPATGCADCNRRSCVMIALSILLHHKASTGSGG